MKKIIVAIVLMTSLVMGFFLGKVDTIHNIQILDGQHVEVKGQVYEYE